MVCIVHWTNDESEREGTMRRKKEVKRAIDLMSRTKDDRGRCSEEKNRVEIYVCMSSRGAAAAAATTSQLVTGSSLLGVNEMSSVMVEWPVSLSPTSSDLACVSSTM